MLRNLSQLAIAVILAVGLSGLALLSIQNVTPVSLNLLMFQSIQLPVGLLLTFCMAGGLVMGALFPLLSGGKRRSPKISQQDLDRDFDFDDLM